MVQVGLKPSIPKGTRDFSPSGTAGAAAAFGGDEPTATVMNIMERLGSLNICILK